jgi:hypothetical protein
MPAREIQMIDRTSKILLALIAAGVWVHVALSYYQQADSVYWLRSIAHTLTVR